MADPFDKTTSKAPPTIGQGCLSRYDPQALGPEDGADFSGAAAVWDQSQPALPDAGPEAGITPSSAP